MSGRILIGIDGGGTRLRAAIANDTGQFLGGGEAGTGNYHDVGAGEVRANIARAIAQAWASAGIAPRWADAIFLGLGSVVTAEDRAVVCSIVDDLSLASNERVGVDHDLRVALAGGLAGQPGVVLIAGTGSSCYGRNEQGEHWQAGGWGPILDDPGSSYWLGLQAMVAAIRFHDGRGKSTALHDLVIKSLGLNDIRDILRRVELDGMTRSEIASLAPLVTKAAASGDEVAKSLIDEGADQLAIMVAAVCKRLDFSSSALSVPVVVTGGLTNAGNVFLTPLWTAISRHAEKAEIVDAKMPPVLGAVLLAAEVAGIEVTIDLVARLIASSSRQQVNCVA